MGKIVTFYSYKGGTGRSMALANAAWVLASNGAKVLVVDWDLEAPGLHRYFRPFLADKELVRTDSQGVIDFMADFAERLVTPAAPDEKRPENWYEEFADISAWSKPLLWTSGTDALSERGSGIDFVPAGRQSPQYGELVNSFDWAGFYKHGGGAFMDAVRKKMRRYDWVLIDSRTGVSDTSGICTTQLPDILVVCFTLNYQSIDGASAVAASAKQKRPDLRILPLPTRLDGNEEKLLKAMMTYARQSFGSLLDPDLDPARYWREMGVPYFSRYAYLEKLAPFEDNVSDATSTLPSMEKLTAYITGGKHTALLPLPEAERTAALEEFERLPGDVEAADQKLPAISSGFWRNFLDALRYRTFRYVWLRAGLLALFAVVIAISWYTKRGTNPAGGIVQTLTADAEKDLKEGSRDDAALLIAAAAASLDPTTIVTEGAGPGGNLYRALLSLSPLKIGSNRGGFEKLRFSPDGTAIARTAPKAEGVLIQLGKDEQAFREVPAGYSDFEFSPDSKFFAAGGRNGSINVIDLSSGTRVWQWENKDPDATWVTAMAFSPDGNLLAAAFDTGAIMVARVDTWSEFKQTMQKGVRLLKFSPDSAYLASGGDGTRVTWWAMRSGVRDEIFEPLDGNLKDMAFIPPPSNEAPLEMVTLSDKYQIFKWVHTRGKPERVLITKDYVEAMDVSSSSELGVARTRSGVGSGNEILSITGSVGSRLGYVSTPDAVAESLRFSRKGEMLGFIAAGSMAVWNLKLTESQLVLDKGAVSFDFAPNDQTVAIGRQGSVLFGFLTDRGPLTFVAADVTRWACSQTSSTSLDPAAWSKYFGNEPPRSICGSTGQGSRIRIK